MSAAILDGNLYFGGNNADLYRYSDPITAFSSPLSFAVVTEPSAMSLLVLGLALMALQPMRREDAISSIRC